MDRYEEEMIEYQDYDDLVSQYEATVEKEINITTWPWWLQSIETPTEAYDNFKDTYL
ncbi:45421_t:CDS:2, partial [Gigaspora margarita]